MIAFQVDAMFTTSWVHFASTQAHVGPIWTQFGHSWSPLGAVLILLGPS